MAVVGLRTAAWAGYGYSARARGVRAGGIQMTRSDRKSSSTGVLYCAGRRGSFDQSFYRWVLRSTGVRVEPVGGYRDVVRTLQRTAPPADGPAAGVVDRDARPDHILARQAETVEVLPYFEVESYLIHPSILGAALRHRGLRIQTKDMMAILLDAARGTYMPAINAHLNHAPKSRGSSRLEQMAAQYAEQLERADEIIKRGNADALLRYFPGRQLSHRVARKLDFLSAQHLLDTVLQVPGLRDQCRPVRDLRRALMLRLGL